MKNLLLLILTSAMVTGISSAQAYIIPAQSEVICQAMRGQIRCGDGTICAVSSPLISCNSGLVCYYDNNYTKCSNGVSCFTDLNGKTNCNNGLFCNSAGTVFRCH